MQRARRAFAQKRYVMLESEQREKKLGQGICVGCAGWSIGKKQAHLFPDGGSSAGSHLERYAQCLPAVEINSSFYRSHRPATYQRWAFSVPDHFRFAVKMPRQITHVARLAGSAAQPLLEDFLGEVAALGSKLGPLLVQLPPSLAFDANAASAFLDALRKRFAGIVVCEPRHPTWFESDAEQVLVHFRVARVAADPAPVPRAARPGGWGGFVYYRLHGSPRIYYSAYSEGYLETLARELTMACALAPTWCIFDNTAQGAATTDATSVVRRLEI